MYKEYFYKRIGKIKIFDKPTFHKILQIIQYSILYVVIGFVLGSFIEKLFQEFDPEKKNFRNY